MDLKTIIQSKGYLILAAVLVAVAILFLTFSAGMYIGFRKARFSYQWGENYHVNFAGPRSGFIRDFGGKDLIDAHGVSGQIIKIDSSIIIIKGSDGVEKSVAVNGNTTIRQFKETIKLSDLKVDDLIVIIGSPNDKGQIDAKFVRVLPPSSTILSPKN